jgi:DNA-binding response OmpR family regulator
MCLRILIVEDDALTAAAFAAALNDAGHVVAVTEHGTGAPAKAARMQADLALVDITLRDGRTGLAAARALRENSVATLIVSGDADLRAKAESVQALGYIAKPADADVVARVVNAVERHRPWSAGLGVLQEA